MMDETVAPALFLSGRRATRPEARRGARAPRARARGCASSGRLMLEDAVQLGTSCM